MAVVGSPCLSQWPSYLVPILGHINHALFWKNLAPSASQGKGAGGQIKPGPLKDAIDAAFGNIENMKQQFNATTAAIQGSGWGWIVSDEAFGLATEQTLVYLPSCRASIRLHKVSRLSRR